MPMNMTRQREIVRKFPVTVPTGDGRKTDTIVLDIQPDKTSGEELSALAAEPDGDDKNEWLTNAWEMLLAAGAVGWDLMEDDEAGNEVNMPFTLERFLTLHPAYSMTMVNKVSSAMQKRIGINDEGNG